jgi:adenylosuccinate lyase
MHNSGHFKSVGFAPFDAAQNKFLDDIITNFDTNEAQKVKDIEKVTRHDVKAVEYYLGDKFKANPTLVDKTQWLHFACTSEDITNLSYAMMLDQARTEVLIPKMDEIVDEMVKLAVKYADTPMMSRTHGQTATPTTVGKEMGNFAVRLAKQRKNIAMVDICGKFNGAVGNHNAHLATYPNLPWLDISNEFVTKSLNIKWSRYSTQIEFHDYISELFDSVSRFNTILLDFNRDMWSYVSLDYWKLATIEGEVGSSTMPHKVNPIDFENSEGNIGLANSTFHHLSTKLPISRFQRDLSDSTVLRNIGVGCGYSLIAYDSVLRGISKVALNEAKVISDLENRWELMAEPVQTFMRANNVPNAYEHLKAVTRGKSVTKEGVMGLLEDIKTPENKDEVERLSQITPLTYTGTAKQLALEVPDVVAQLRK